MTASNVGVAIRGIWEYWLAHRWMLHPETTFNWTTLYCFLLVPVLTLFGISAAGALRSSSPSVSRTLQIVNLLAFAATWGMVIVFAMIESINQ